ncbi:MAG: hypothetical protein LBH70_10030 [Spirochaetaceae bacterium]|jgi:hypothetical protein|nr:hypothetical protein [Spirochaetaceae bacterium]
MVRLALCIALVFFTPFFVEAEGEGSPVSGAADFFPILSLYETALAGEVSWRPDWPLSMPPDAFSFPPYGGSALTLIRDGEDPGDQPAGDLTIRRNSAGLLSAFPLFKDDWFFQVQTRFGRDGRIRGFTIPAETPELETFWDILIMEYENALPSLIRISQGGTWYFTEIEYQAAAAVEIWYDQDRNALAVFSYRYETPGGRLRRFTRMDVLSGEEFTEAYHYDSMGNISGVVTSAGEYSALYVGKNMPRYWARFAPLRASHSLEDDQMAEADIGRFSLQWNEAGLLVHFTSSYQTEDMTENDNMIETEARYEYIQNDRGGWIERRDTPMSRYSGFLIPGPAKRHLRHIEYPVP